MTQSVGERGRVRGTEYNVTNFSVFVLTNN